METPNNFMVCTWCSTYNHHAYIEDAMNGFCIQKTDFPFVCIIADDASTDGNQEVIRKYFESNFNLLETEETDDFVLNYGRHKTNENCYFVVLYLKYNHYSIKKSRGPYVSRWYDNPKYIALCEGDDYWIDENKLQKQVDFLEEHESCTMVCNNAKWFSVKKNDFVKAFSAYEKSQYCNVKDVIIEGGWFINTCSIVYRPEIRFNYPEYCRNCYVGDYPLQIMAAMKGMVYYMNDVMSVYRTDNSQSWVGRQLNSTFEIKIKGYISEIRMLKGFALDFPQYKNLFQERISHFLNIHIPLKRKNKREHEAYMRIFHDELSKQQYYYRVERIINENNSDIWGWVIRKPLKVLKYIMYLFR